MHLAAEHIVTVHSLGGDEVGRDDHIVNIVFVHKTRHGVAPVFAVVDGVDMVVILGQEGHIAVAEGVLDHQTVGRVRDALVDHMGQSAVRGQEGGIAGILVHVPGLFRDQRPFGSLGAVRKVGVEGDVSLGHIAVQRIGTQLFGPADLAVQGAGELALIPQGEGVQRRGLLAGSFAHGLVGVVGAKLGPAQAVSQQGQGKEAVQENQTGKDHMFYSKPQNDCLLRKRQHHYLFHIRKSGKSMRGGEIVLLGQTAGLVGRNFRI